MSKAKSASKPKAARGKAGVARRRARPAKAGGRKAPKKTKPRARRKPKAITVPRPKKLDLRDPAVRAKLKQHNLERLKEKAPGVFDMLADFQPVSKLVIHDDGTPDILFEGQHFYNRQHDAYVADQLKAYWEKPDRLEMAPLQPKNFDDTASVFLNNILDRGNKAGAQFHVHHTTDESYYLCVLGFGLGGHLFELVDRTNCRALGIVEVNPEFLYHSLEVFDWCWLFDVADARDGLVTIIIGNNPNELNFRLRGWLRSVNLLSFDGTTIFVHYNNAVFTSTIKKLMEDKNLVLSGLGFFYDETLMIKNTHHNLYSGKERVYLRPDKPRIMAPVFVIGNGPSLDNDLDFIRENQDKAIIVSSGSSLRPLVVNGIMPDFQMETENINVRQLIAQVAEDHDISSITLVTSSTVDIEVPPYFDNVLYYFRGSLSAYPVFCDTERRCLAHPNPTVVNASLGFAQESGFRYFYMLGTDMGTTMGAGRHHSKYAYQYTEGAIHRQEVYNIPVPANFGGTCMASNDMYWTRDAVAKALRELGRGRTYYNCSNGSRIEGTLSMPSKMVKLEEIPGGKKPIIEQIYKYFPVYTREEFDAHWNDDKIQDLFNEWLDRFEKLALKRKNYDNLNYLTELMGHLNPTKGFSLRDAGPALAYRGTLFQILLAFEYYRRRLAKEDVRKFERIARQEMQTAVDFFRKETKKEFGTLSRDAAKRLEAEAAKKRKKSAKKRDAAAARA